MTVEYIIKRRPKYKIEYAKYHPMTDKKYPIGGYAPGSYQCKCTTCGGGFFGDKRAVQCEPCATAAKAKFDALSPEEQAEVERRNIEAYKLFISQNFIP